MAGSHEDFPVIIIAFVAGVAVTIYILISKLVRRATISNPTDEEPTEKSKTSLFNASKKALHQSTSDKSNNRKRYVEKNIRDGKQPFHHPWLLTSLKGHSSNILDMKFSYDGKYLATCGKDGAIFLWNAKFWGGKNHRYVRVNVKYDYASLICWCDSRSFLIKREKENVIEAYKMDKAKGLITQINPVITYPKFHEDDIIGLEVNCKRKFIMTCTNKTDIVISDFKGCILTRLNSHLGVNYSAHLSPCGKYIVASGFAPDAKMWHIEYTKSGDFENVTRVVHLRGHNAGIYDTSFNAFASTVGTLSKDGTWKLFDLAELCREEPQLIRTGTYEPKEVSSIALSPFGDVVAVASGTSLLLYYANTAMLDIVIDDIFSDVITRICFDSSGKYVFVCGDRHVRIFHNLTGVRAGVEVARAKLKKVRHNQAFKDRLKEQISKAEAFIASIST